MDSHRRVSQHPFLTAAPKPRIFGHRGFVSPEMKTQGIVENTRAAFAAALAAGATHLESDCRLTRDGRVVLFHDEDLSRLLDDPRKCAEVDYSELSSMLRNRGGLLALEEALDAFPSARFNIDVKSASAASAAGRILGQASHRVLVTSFSDALRRRAYRAAKGNSEGERPAVSPGKFGIISVLLSVAVGSAALMDRAFRNLDALQVPERHGRLKIVTPRLIAEAHRRGVEVHVWTINDPARMRALVELGVDGIVTDRTDLARSALNAR